MGVEEAVIAAELIAAYGEAGAGAGALSAAAGGVAGGAAAGVGAAAAGELGADLIAGYGAGAAVDSGLGLGLAEGAGGALAGDIGADLIAGYGTEGLSGSEGLIGSQMAPEAASGGAEGFAASTEGAGGVGSTGGGPGTVDLMQPSVTPEATAPEVVAPEVATPEAAAPQSAFDSGTEFNQMAQAQPDQRGVLDQILQWAQKNPRLASATVQGGFGVARGVGDAMSREAMMNKKMAQEKEMAQWYRDFADRGQFRGSVGFGPRVPAGGIIAARQK